MTSTAVTGSDAIFAFMIGRRTEFDALVSPPITASIGEVMLTVQYVNPPCNQVQEVLGRTERPRVHLPRPASPRLGAEVRPAVCLVTTHRSTLHLAFCTALSRGGIRAPESSEPT